MLPTVARFKPSSIPLRMMISIKKPVSVQMNDEYKLLFMVILTVGREPTLSCYCTIDNRGPMG